MATRQQIITGKLKLFGRRAITVGMVVVLLLGVGSINPRLAAADAMQWQATPDWGLELESRATDGGYGSGAVNGGVNAGVPVVSGDGRYVAFASWATNMVPGGDANSTAMDGILHDRLTGQNEYAFLDANGQQYMGNNTVLQLSYDGRYVLLQGAGIWLRDRKAGTIERLGGSYDASMSADARYIAFSVYTDELIPGGLQGDKADTVVLDRFTGQTELISQRADGGRFGGYSLPGNASGAPAISADGRYVVFMSEGDDSSQGDTNGHRDIYVRDRATGTTTWVSKNVPDRNECQVPVIAADGSTVVYQCEHRNSWGSYLPQIFTTKLATGQTELVGVDDTGYAAPEENTHFPSISADGRYVAFRLMTYDIPLAVAIRDLQSGHTTLLTQGAADYGEHANFSANGKWVVFEGAGMSGGAVYARPLPFNTENATYTPDNVIAPGAPTDVAAASPTQKPQLSWNAVPGADHYFIYRDGRATPINASSATTYTDTAVLPDGSHTYTVSAVNSVGLESAPSAPVSVVVDTTAPAVTGLSWSANPLLQGQNTELRASIGSDVSGIAGVTYSVDGGAPQAMAYDAAAGVWKASFGQNLAVNTYTISVAATDGAGNAGPAQADILAVYNAANGYVSGHEKFVPGGSDTLPVAPDTATNHPAELIIGFTNLKAATSTAPTSGSFNVSYVVQPKKDGFDLSSTSVDWLAVADSTHASILGHATLTTYVNGVKTVTQNVAVRFDVALGVNGQSDHVTMKIFSPGLNLNTDTPTWATNDNGGVGSQLKIKP